jgi:hypothetical protein
MSGRLQKPIAGFSSTWMISPGAYRRGYFGPQGLEVARGEGAMSRRSNNIAYLIR